MNAIVTPVADAMAEAEEATQALKDTAAILAAELMRLAAGAGNGGAATRQAQATVAAWSTVRDLVRREPQAFNGAVPPLVAVGVELAKSAQADDELSSAESAVIIAALRVTAARLMGQSMHGKRWLGELHGAAATLAGNR